jgi:hypothetical protein
MRKNKEKIIEIKQLDKREGEAMRQGEAEV